MKSIAALQSTILLALGILLSSLTIFGPKAQEISTADLTAKEPINTISVETYRQWTASWAKYGSGYSQENLILYYNMPLVDLKQVIAEGANSSRFYMGLDTTKTPYRAHLLLVGVDKQGRDMLNEAKQQYVYDLSSPCPPGCD